MWDLRHSIFLIATLALYESAGRIAANLQARYEYRYLRS